MWEWREGWAGVWPVNEGGGTWHEGRAGVWPANEGGRAWCEGQVGAWPADEGGRAWDTNNTIRRSGYNEIVRVVVDESEGGDRHGIVCMQADLEGGTRCMKGTYRAIPLALSSDLSLCLHLAYDLLVL